MYVLTAVGLRNLQRAQSAHLDYARRTLKGAEKISFAAEQLTNLCQTWREEHDPETLKTIVEYFETLCHYWSWFEEYAEDHGKMMPNFTHIISVLDELADVAGAEDEVGNCVQQIVDSVIPLALEMSPAMSHQAELDIQELSGDLVTNAIP